MSRDRRTADRVRVAIRPWRVDRCAEDAPVIFRGSAVILDLSVEGAKLEVHDELVEGDGIALAFQYRNRHFTLQATVMWVGDEETEADGPPARVVGVRFEDVPPLTAGRLASVLTHHASLNRAGR